jgi:hypothetical protein
MAEIVSGSIRFWSRRSTLRIVKMKIQKKSFIGGSCTPNHDLTFIVSQGRNGVLVPLIPVSNG